MKNLGLFTLLGAMLPLLSMSQTVSRAQADAALQEAISTYAGTEQEIIKSLPSHTSKDVHVWFSEDNDTKPNTNHPHYTAGKHSTDVDLNELQLRVDLENMTLSDALFNVVNKIGDETGPWQLRWRLKPENISVKEEVVNLIAEASFGEFIAYLSDRVKNMTGVQLFVSVFDGTRVIVISDTYN